MFGAVVAWCALLVVVVAGEGNTYASVQRAGADGVLGEEDALLQALAGARGGNRLAVCGGGGGRGPCLPRQGPQRCPAVAWRRGWALARAACVLPLALEHMRVLRTTKLERTCDALQQEPALVAGRARRVVGAHVQPLWARDARYDVALLELDRPFAEEEPFANSTAAKQCLLDVQYWMEKVQEDYWNRLVDGELIHSNATPYTLLLTGILPTAAFLLLFLFVTFHTGTPLKVPYTNSMELQAIETPWLTYQYSTGTGAKWFPTYGQV